MIDVGAASVAIAPKAKKEIVGAALAEIARRLKERFVGAALAAIHFVIFSINIV